MATWQTKSIRASLLGLLLCALYLMSAEALFAQVPQIILPLVPSSAAPGSAPPAGPGLTITVNGTGFTPGAEVYWNGSPRTTHVVSSTKLTASITPEDIESPGTAWVFVQYVRLALIRSNVVYFEITNPTNSVSFARTDYSVGSAPPAVMVADFNGDGVLDLAVTNIGDNSVSILLGNGDGTFRSFATFATGTNPLRGIVGDFNNDGVLDLAIPNKFSNNVSVLLGNGDGTFQAAMNFATASGPTVVAAGDFNGDGNLDLVTSSRFASSVSVLLGNGDGTFQSPLNFAVSSYPESVSVGDFNGDGRPDLAVPTDDGTVNILLGNGDGTFQPPARYSAGNIPFYASVADFNGDGRLDLAVANFSGANISILLGNGDGTFQSAVNYATGPAPGSVSVADFNGDGKPDLVVANYGDNYVSVLLGNGDGTFQGALNYTVGSGPSLATFGDFNGDGRMDLAVSNQNSNTVSILLQPIPNGGLVQLNGGNSFTGNQTVNGTVTATSFVGNGSGLTGIIAQTANSANTANFAVSAGDAMTLGGIPAGGFAPASGSANYVAKSGDTMSGTLNLPVNGLVAGGNQLVLSGGNVGVGTATPDAVSGYTSLHIDNEGTGFGGAFLELTHGSTGAKGRVVMDDHGLLLHALNSEPVKIKSGNFTGGGDSGHIYVSTSGNVGIGTGTPAATLDVNGTANFSGLVTFAAGQTFPGTGGGTITGVTAGSGLFGGGTAGSISLSIPSAGVTNSMLANPLVTLNAGAGLAGGGAVALGGSTTVSLATNTCAAGSAVTAHPFTCSPFATLGSNTFAGNQTMPSLTVSEGNANAAIIATNTSSGTGILASSASGFGVSGTSTFTGVAGFGNIVGVSAVSGNGNGIYAQSSGPSPSGAAGVFNICSACPSNLLPGVFAGGDIIDGLNGDLPMFRVNYKGDVTSSGNIAAAGTVTIGTGGTPIAEYVSTTYSATLPVLTSGSCIKFTTAALTGFDPGISDTIALGIPGSLTSSLPTGIFLMWQAWETGTAASPTITIQVCNPTGSRYAGGATGTIRIDVFKH